jgi:hypothetical protein
MNITKEIINDLIPLYAANECSADTRNLVEEYLEQNPRQADELRRMMETSIPKGVTSPERLDEVRSFREARRRLRKRSWLMAFAIFFSLVPFSFVWTGKGVWWFLRDAPASAAVYAVLGVALWIVYAVQRSRARSL